MRILRFALAIYAAVAWVSPAVSAPAPRCGLWKEGLVEGQRLIVTDKSLAEAAFRKSLLAAQCSREPGTVLAEIRLWLARSLYGAGHERAGEVRDLLDDVLAARRELLGDSHPDTAVVYLAQAQVFNFERDSLGELDRLNRALSILSHSLPKDDPRIGRALLRRGGVRCDLGDRVNAEADLEGAVEILSTAKPDQDYYLAQALGMLADLAGERGQESRRERLEEEAATLMARARASERWRWHIDWWE